MSNGSRSLSPLRIPRSTRHVVQTDHNEYAAQLSSGPLIYSNVARLLEFLDHECILAASRAPKQSSHTAPADAFSPGSSISSSLNPDHGI